MNYDPADPTDSWYKLYNSKTFDERMERYGQFLKDGDMEEWLPYCYMDRNSDEYCRALTRALWIISRFAEWQSPQWKQLGNLTERYFKRLDPNGWNEI